MSYFKNSDFFRSKFLNRTKQRIISTICRNMIKISSEEIFVEFEEYVLKNSTVTMQEAENYLKLHGDFPDLIYGLIMLVIIRKIV